MKEFIKKISRSDLFFKVLSVILAVVCWIYIVFVTNPEIEVKITNIPVTLSNHQAIKNEGYIVANEINTTVDIKVKGTRRMLANLDEDSIIAYVDLSECMGKKTYNLPVTIKLPYEDISLVSSSTLKIPVSVDKYISKDFPVEYYYFGELKNSNYMIHGEPVIYTPTVSVSGPEPIINTIEKAVIAIDRQNASDDVTGLAPVKLMNSNNAEVVSKTIDMKNKDISYSFVVYQKKNVPVEPELWDDTGMYECDVHGKTITVVGPASDVEGINVIHTKRFGLEKVNSEGVCRVELIIPEGITIEEDNTTVKVFVKRK